MESTNLPAALASDAGIGFWLFAAIAVISALVAVTSTNRRQAGAALGTALFGVAWLMLDLSAPLAATCHAIAGTAVVTVIWKKYPRTDSRGLKLQISRDHNGMLAFLICVITVIGIRFVLVVSRIWNFASDEKVALFKNAALLDTLSSLVVSYLPHFLLVGLLFLALVMSRVAQTSGRQY